MSTRRFKDFLAYFSVVTLLFARQIGSLLDEPNRFFLHWDLRDTAILFLTIALLAILLSSLGAVLEAARWRRALRVWDHLFLLLLFSGLLAVQPVMKPGTARMGLAWLLIPLVIGFSLGHPGSRLVWCGKALALSLSPLVAVLGAQMLLLESWGPSSGPPVHFPRPPRASYPVFIVVFDGLSFERMMRAGQVAREYRHLRDLVDRSFSFRNARSSGGYTYVSLPSIIHQADPAWPREEVMSKVTHPTGPWDRVRSSPSLFEIARRHDYNAGLIGFYLPYPKLLDGRLDFCLSRPYLPKGDGLVAKMALDCVRNLPYLTDPVSPALTRKANQVPAASVFHYRYAVQREVLDETLWVLGHAPANTLVLSHMPAPHAPFVFLTLSNCRFVVSEAHQ